MTKKERLDFGVHALDERTDAFQKLFDAYSNESEDIFVDTIPKDVAVNVIYNAVRKKQLVGKNFKMSIELLLRVSDKTTEAIVHDLLAWFRSDA